MPAVNEATSLMRLQKVSEMLNNEMTRGQILQNTTEWGISERAIDEYISKATETIKDSIKQSIKYDTEAHFKELDMAKEIALVPKGKDGNVDIGPAIKAIELKGKLCGLYTEKTQLTGADGGAVIFNFPSDFVKPV